MSTGILERVVGEPIHEACVTGAVAASAASLLPPGSGRRLFVSSEVELGIGRPDLVMVAISPAILAARKRKGIRFANLAEARMLAEILGFGPSGYSQAHVRTVHRRLRDRGMLTSRTVSNLLKTELDSVIIEAKMNDWKSGLRQLSRTSWLANRSAMAMPTHTLGRVSESFLLANRVGLIDTDMESGVARWAHCAPSSPVSLGARMWLAEIALRATA